MNKTTAKRRPATKIRSLMAIGTILLVVCICSLPAARFFASQKLPGTQPVQFRLLWLSDPSTQATISWSTAEHGAKHIVRYESAPDDKGLVASHHDGKYTGGNTFYHHVRLTDLRPATEYRVVIESDDERSQTLYFRTAPSEDVDLKIIFGGDSRSNREDRRKMNQMISQYVNDDDSILAFAHGGDYIQSGKNFDEWSAWMSDHELTMTAENRLVPLIPTRGNHDSGPLFDEIFDRPGGENPNYYAMNIGPQIRWITLNTETVTAGDQAAWLEKEMRESRPTKRWLLAQYHRPAYPAVKQPGSALQSWVPIFEQHNLDVACEADGHCMKRTVPIRGGKPDKTGVVYVGEGGLGVKQRTPDTKRWYLQEPGFASSGHHFQLLGFSSNQLKCETVRLGGEIADTQVITARE